MAPNTVTTPHQNTPRQSAQAAEGSAREATGNAIPANETADALAVADADGGPIDPGAAPIARTEPEPRPAPTPEPKSKHDETRDAINKRFREARAAAIENERDDISEFARTAGLPPEFAQIQPQPEPEPAPEPQAEPVATAPAEPAPQPQPQPQPQEQMVEIVVRGEKKMVPLSEALSKAQIAFAADDTLEQAKQKYKELDELVGLARNRVQRPDPVGEHHAATGTQTTEQNPPSDEPQHQGQKLVEAIQFGDPEEAETHLRNTIAATARSATQQALAEARLQEEGQRAAKVLKDFKDQHPDIASDDMATAAMERKVFALQLEDLRNVGFDLDKFSRENLRRPATPADIANIHRDFRANNVGVRAPDQLLETALNGYLEWRGVKAANTAEPQPQPQPQQNAPVPAQRQPTPARVEVTVDRTVRRQAIPPQPSRTAAPRTEPAAPAPATRSGIVQRMQAARAAKRGQVIGA